MKSLTFRYFLATYVNLTDATTERTLPWQWWPVHDEMVADLEAPRLVVLKARQLGWSWLLAAYALHGAMFRQHYRVLVLSQGQLEASELLRKCRAIWQSLPDWLRPSLSEDNATTMSFVASGGSITALPATEKAGRGETASLVIVDEAAFHPYAATNYAAYKPTVDAGGQLIVVSTANGAGGFFHSLYQDAKNGINGFVARFYPWSVRPGRDAAWYERQKAEYRSTTVPLDQEYPSDDTTAFMLSGNLRFDRDALRQHRENADARKPLPAPRILAADLPSLLHPLVQQGQLLVWVLPQPGVPYVQGSDVAEGLDGRDYSCSMVGNARTLEHVATLHGHWEPGTFAQYSEALARWYNQALWGIERNNHGHTCIYVADHELHYPRLYAHPEEQTMRQRQSGQQPTRRLGWPTTSGTKPGLIDDLADAIASYALTSYDAAFWGECQTYVVLPNGSTGAGEGSHDDRVMAMAITRRMAMQPGATTARPAATQQTTRREEQRPRHAYRWGSGR